MSGEEMDANARLIVRAVNYHERLENALKACFLALLNETPVRIASEEKKQAARLIAELDQEDAHD